MNSKPLIQLQNIKKIFYTDEVETWAVNDVNLSINKGEYISICGPSGCGKSTLLSILGMLNSSSEGKYLLEGEDVASLGQAERAGVRNRQIGFIFQAFNLIGDLTVYENVELPLTYRKELSKEDRKKKVTQALEKVDMAHRMKHYPAQLSGGQQQRVAIARALAGDPKVLMADEPTGNLDSKNAKIVMELLKELHKQGNTICMVTHDPEAALMAERQITLLDGQIISDEGTKGKTASADTVSAVHAAAVE
ncbi:ABC transporter ATP-binding protein [Alteromonas sp. a30]|uniref:ABC transporter ATP-binding protein n=1 Tax=Alteromonas sp. a30 TaxID=2730917 RepID=UPI002282509C|nr:ABC transporter ATP-binding protein [Alteromonas sp. a30]MCY7295062.1 ABC transporter ATP-binding protein [Alteromonas sp. a30]